ncbi:MAG: NAD(P)H-binding protein [Cyclobacteriaceae bacterium]|nr:NAD(P)H-binding protein [Cyclobacteriaceae bacterium]MCH8517354.1 NAD(P)H-binding protein [Cyclobacteriaceae bacterium]
MDQWVNICIIGCGWVGEAFADECLKKNLHVAGSSRSTEKLARFKEKGILPLHINLEGETTIKLPFKTIDFLVIAIPPGRKMFGDEKHPKQMQQLKEALENTDVRQLVYISSTSVYPSEPNHYNEDSSTVGGAEAIKAGEKIAKEISTNCTILRAGGLMGYDRRVGRYFAGKEGTIKVSGVVNYVHRDDVVQALFKVMENLPLSETFNLVSPVNANKEEVIQRSCERLGLEAPQMDYDPYERRIVSGERISDVLAFKYQHSDPRDFA